MVDRIIRLGKVVDNKDPLKIGRVKCEILPELKGIAEDNLPWVNPPQDFYAMKNFSQQVPSKGSYIIVEINEVWTDFAYSGLRPYSLQTDGSENAFKCLDKVDGLKSKKDGSQPSNMKYKKDPEYLNFYDTETGEFGIVFSNGRYFIWSGKNDKKFIFGYKDDSAKYLEIKEDGSFKWLTHNGSEELASIELKKEGDIELVNKKKKTSIKMTKDGDINICNDNVNSSIKMSSGGNIDAVCMGSTKINMTASDVQINNHFKVTV